MCNCRGSTYNLPAAILKFADTDFFFAPIEEFIYHLPLLFGVIFILLKVSVVVFIFSELAMFIGKIFHL